MYYDLRTTMVKVGQERFSTLMVDFCQKFILTFDLILFIFAIFFVHYFIYIALTVYQKRLIIVPCFKTALSIELSFDRGCKS